MALVTIKHGAKVDIPTGHEMRVAITEAVGGHRYSEESRHRVRGTIQLDGAGNGADELHTPRLYDWTAERIVLTAGAGGLFQLFENSTQGTDLLEVATLGANGLYSDAFANKLWIPAGTRLMITVSGGGAGAVATYNLQVLQIKRRSS